MCLPRVWEEPRPSNEDGERGGGGGGGGGEGGEGGQQSALGLIIRITMGGRGVVLLRKEASLTRTLASSRILVGCDRSQNCGDSVRYSRTLKNSQL